MIAAQPLQRDIAPPEFLQLAGHPVRWRLLSELARSDRVVSELTGLVGEPQNLISYHLGKLRGGRLVSARRSSADGRDTYYGLDLQRFGRLLSAVGGSLHPGLRLAPPRDDEGRIQESPKGPSGAPARVLFLCTGNSARSQMAEALIRVKSGGTVEAMSAGSHPKALHPNAVRVMRDVYGLDLAGHVPKHLDVYAGERFDWVISLCDRVREVCPDLPGWPEAVHWSLANPATGEADDVTYPRFLETAAALATRIDYLLAVLAEPKPASSAGDSDV